MLTAEVAFSGELHFHPTSLLFTKAIPFFFFLTSFVSCFSNTNSTIHSYTVCLFVFRKSSVTCFWTQIDKFALQHKTADYQWPVDY